MNRNVIKIPIEYSSLSLILSYFFIHNIYLVLIGITFTLCLINSNHINRFAIYISKILETISANKDIKIDNIKKKDESIGIELEKDSKLKLVEEVEALGIIPSLNRDDGINAT